jgi:hypothetical protein
MVTSNLSGMPFADGSDFGVPGFGPTRGTDGTSSNLGIFITGLALSNIKWFGFKKGSKLTGTPRILGPCFFTCNTFDEKYTHLREEAYISIT